MINVSKNVEKRELQYTMGGNSFPGGSDSKESACNAGGMSSIPGLGRSSGERRGYQHYTGGSNQDHPQEKEMQTGKMVY